MRAADPAPLLRLLGDPTRLRILALLDREELSVGELARSLGLAQSRVSNHLRLLREAGLLAERHAGTSTFLRRLAPSPTSTPTPTHPLAARLWSALTDSLDSLPEHTADLVRLDTVLSDRRDRAGEFFDRVAEEWDKLGVAFDTGQARQRAAAKLLPPDLTVADLGCGTGYFSAPLLGHCARLLCVDQSPRMLAEAAKRLQPVSRGTTLDFRQGELTALPIDSASLDGTVAGMVLHHLPDLAPPLSEMRRVLRPGGTAVVVELAPHGETWMQPELGDRHLGLAPSDVLTALERVGFTDVALDPLDDHYCPTRPDGTPVRLALYAVRGRVPRDPSAAGASNGAGA